MVQSSCTKNRKKPSNRCRWTWRTVCEPTGGQARGPSRLAGQVVIEGIQDDPGDLEAARQTWLAAFQDAQERAKAERSDFLAYAIPGPLR